MLDDHLRALLSLDLVYMTQDGLTLENIHSEIDTIINTPMEELTKIQALLLHELFIYRIRQMWKGENNGENKLELQISSH